MSNPYKTLNWGLFSTDKEPIPIKGEGKILVVTDDYGGAYMGNNENKMRKAIEWKFLTQLEYFDEDMADHMRVDIDDILEGGNWNNDSEAKLLKWWYSLPFEKAVLYADMHMEELDLDDAYQVYADGPNKAIVINKIKHIIDAKGRWEEI